MVYCKNCKYHEDNKFKPLWPNGCQHPKLFTIIHDPEDGELEIRDWDYINKIRRPYPEFEYNLYRELNRNFNCQFYEEFWIFKLKKFLRLV